MSARHVALAAALLALVAPRLATANPGGVAGYTGKPTSSAPAGESCNKCHSGGAAPQVSITGPSSLAASQSGDYAVVVTSGLARASGAVAATDGVALVPVSGLRDSFGELVQTGSQAAGGSAVQLRFRATAPARGGSFDLWAVGLGSNGSGTGGDRAAHAKITVAVTGGGSSAGGASPSDAGAPPAGSTPRDAGVHAEAGATGDDGADDGDGDDPDPGAPARPGWERTSAGSCAASGAAPGAPAPPLTILFGIGLLAASRARRRWAGLAIVAAIAGAGCAGAAPSPGDDEPGAGASAGSPGKVDPSEGRDATATSCFAACQGATFVCRTQKGEARASSRAELAAEPTGCAGALVVGDATTPIALDCVERKACVGGGSGRVCAPATFGALSFAYTSAGATTTCTRVAE